MSSLRNGIAGLTAKRRANYRLAIGRPPAHKGAGPTKLDRFILTRRDPRADQGWSELEHDALTVSGATRVRIVLTSDDPDVVLSYQLVYWQMGAPRCRGNGEVAVRYNADFTSTTEEACDPGTCPIYRAFEEGKSKRKLCAPAARLSFQLPGAGLCEFRTTSWNTIKLLVGSLEDIVAMTGGKLAGFPCDLVVAPGKVGRLGTNRRTAYLVSLEPPSWDEIREYQRAHGLRHLTRGPDLASVSEDADGFADAFAVGDDADVPFDPETGEVLEPPAPETPTLAAVPLPETWAPPAQTDAPDLDAVLAEVGNPDEWRR